MHIAICLMPWPLPLSGISSLAPLKAGTAPALSWMCSAVAGLSSLHPSIRPCPVIYNSSGILPPSTLCTRTALTFCLVPSYAAPTCVWGVIPSQRGSIWKGCYCSCVFILFWLCPHSAVIVRIRLLVWLSVSLLLVLLLLCPHMCQVSCLPPLLVSV